MLTYLLDPLCAHCRISEEPGSSTLYCRPPALKPDLNLNIVVPVLLLLSFSTCYGSTTFCFILHPYPTYYPFAVVDILSSFFLKTRPIHLQLLVASRMFVASCPVFLNSCLFETNCGQNIHITFRRHFVLYAYKQIFRNIPFVAIP